MAVERITPQLVKKGKGKKRPGYRGDRGYQGGSGAPGSAESTSMGGDGGYGGGGRQLSGADYRRSAREFTQAVNNARAIEDAKKAKREETRKNTTRFGYAKPKSKFGGILGSIVGMMMGIPGLGLLTGGLGSLGNKLGDTFGNFNETMRGINPVTGKANTQAEYEAMVADRRTQSRIDKMQDRINRGYNQIGIGNFTKQTGPITDNQRATLEGLLGQKDRFGNQFGPSTAQNVLTGRDLKGFTESRGLQTPQTFSDPFANTVGTTTQINNPQNIGIQGIDVGYPSNNLMAGLTKMQQKMLAGPQKNLRNIMGISDQEILNNISPFNDPEDPATLEEVQTFYGADGGLASMFTRRG